MIILDISPVTDAAAAELKWHGIMAGGGVVTYNDSKAIRRTNAERGRKPYKDSFNYVPLAVLERAFFYELYPPTHPAYREKFGQVCDFVAGLVPEYRAIEAWKATQP
jgi:hypothetical protein